MAKAYVIRAQGLGLIHDKVYLSPPSKEDLEKVMVEELRRHGFDKDGNPRERWVRAQEVEVDEEVRGGPAPLELKAKLDEREAKALRAGMNPGDAASAARRGGGESAGGTIAMSGTGTVTNPGEAETIAPEDVAELKL